MMIGVSGLTQAERDVSDDVQDDEDAMSICRAVLLINLAMAVGVNDRSRKADPGLADGFDDFPAVAAKMTLMIQGLRTGFAAKRRTGQGRRGKDFPPSLHRGDLAGRYIDVPSGLKDEVLWQASNPLLPFRKFIRPGRSLEPDEDSITSLRSFTFSEL
jgi:hypothetical protein